jgi:hypothetical protein
VGSQSPSSAEAFHPEASCGGVVKARKCPDACDVRVKANSSNQHAPYGAFASKLQTPCPEAGAGPLHPDPFEIGRLGSAWSIISLDATKKRALARCLGCQQIREISIVDGVPSCGCGRASHRDVVIVAELAFKTGARR